MSGRARRAPMLRLRDLRAADEPEADAVELDVTPGLHEWIGSEIAKYETTASSAEACNQSPWRADICPEGSGLILSATGEGLWDCENAAALCMAAATATHGALHDPKATLRRCAADRKTLAAHPYTVEAVPPLAGQAGAEFGCATCHKMWDEYGGEHVEGRGNCLTILALAEAYGLGEETDRG